MDLAEIIPENRVLIVKKKYTNKYRLLEYLLDRCVADTDIANKRDVIWQTLQEREESMSTGIGLGVAIPHCSSEFVNDGLGLMAVTKQGIDFQAVDDQPVRIIVLLLMPQKRFEKHIKILATIARVFNDEKIRQKVLKTEDPAQIYRIVAEAAEQTAT